MPDFFSKRFTIAKDGSGENRSTLSLSESSVAPVFIALDVLLKRYGKPSLCFLYLQVGQNIHEKLGSLPRVENPVEGQFSHFPVWPNLQGTTTKRSPKPQNGSPVCVLQAGLEVEWTGFVLFPSLLPDKRDATFPIEKPGSVSKVKFFHDVIISHGAGN